MKFLKLLIIALLIPAITLAEMANKSVTKTVTPTVSASPDYTAGDAVGGLQTLTGAGFSGVNGGVLHSVIVTDKATQSGDYDIHIFDSNPTATTVTDNGAITIAAADIVREICVLQVTLDSNYGTGGGVSFANGLNCVFKNTTGTLYAIVVARSALNLASTSDLTFRYGILQD